MNAHKELINALAQCVAALEASGAGGHISDMPDPALDNARMLLAKYSRPNVIPAPSHIVEELIAFESQRLNDPDQRGFFEESAIVYIPNWECGSHGPNGEMAAAFWTVSAGAVTTWFRPTGSKSWQLASQTEW
jgi:hypothetical protein